LGRYQEAISICRALSEAGFATRLAGGCVRDRLLGLRPKDYDLATSATPAQVADLFRGRGEKVIPTGLGHGTVSLVLPGQVLEITTLRRDVTCDGRHAQVAFSDDFREDALRRDFTIKALFEDLDGRIHDYVGGLADLRGKRLRFVGDPRVRIREDYLRSLRYFRFLARYSWPPHEPSLAAIRVEADGLRRLSAERIQAELALILTAPGVVAVWPLLTESGLLTALFPWYHEAGTQALAQLLAATPAACPDLGWFAFLFWGGNSPQPAAIGRAAEALRLPRAVVRLLRQLAEFFHHLQERDLCLTILLHLCERQHLPAEAFLTWLEAADRILALRPPPEIAALVHGLARRQPPALPQGTLLALAPAERGPAVALVKICWYLGLCRDTNEIIGILERRDCFRKRLKAGNID